MVGLGTAIPVRRVYEYNASSPHLPLMRFVLFCFLAEYSPEDIDAYEVTTGFWTPLVLRL